MPQPSSSETPLHIAVLMPLRDDWKSAFVLIRQLDQVLRSQSCTADVLLVDDDSQQAWEKADFEGEYAAVQSIRTLRLRVNVGHQRAIAVGLAHVFATVRCDAVLVMDADGEDTPSGVAELLRAFRQNHGAILIFAERSRRSESLLFRWLYGGYKILHRLLTGLSVRVGNFSVVPFAYLNALVVQSELWNHYAASVFRSKRPFRMVPIPRGRRIAGTSRMNFVGLVAHGLSAISVFGDLVGTRLLMGSCIGAFLVMVGMIPLAVRLFAHQPVPAWALAAAGGLAVIFVQLISMAAIFTFLVLADRRNPGFVPFRDCFMFIAEQVDIYAPSLTPSTLDRS
jgi:hypothetical protein